jgi:hypothetical protein
LTFKSAENEEETIPISGTETSEVSERNSGLDPIPEIAFFPENRSG